VVVAEPWLKKKLSIFHITPTSSPIGLWAIRINRPINRPYVPVPCIGCALILYTDSMIRPEIVRTIDQSAMQRYDSDGDGDDDDLDGSGGGCDSDWPVQVDSQ